MSRPKDRRSAAGLLPNMEARPWKDGKTFTYRYKPIGGKWTALGTNREAALRRVLDMNSKGDGHGTMKWLWERFTDETRPAARWKRLAEGTQDDYRLAWKQLAKSFARVPAGSIESPSIARYVHEERQDAPRRANIEKSLLSLLFGYGILLGVCKINPTIGVEPTPSEASDVIVDAEVLKAFLAWLDKQTPQRRIIGMAAEYASLAGNRQVEFRDLAWTQVDRVAGVIRTKRAKQRGKKRGEVIEVITITPPLATLLDRLRALDRDCLYLFPTQGNNAYTARGFKTLWQRSIAAAIAEGVLTKDTRFNFHALRAYYATMHKRQLGSLPDLHANPETTARVYDRNKEVKRRAIDR